MEKHWGESSARSNLQPEFDASQVVGRSEDRTVDPAASGERYHGPGWNSVPVGRPETNFQGGLGARSKTTAESQQTRPTGMETGSVGLPPVVQGAPVSISGRTEVGHTASVDLQQPCLSSGPHPGHPQRMEMQPTGAMAPCPVTQGNHIAGHQWARSPSGVSGLSLVGPPTPGSGQDGFNAEARGTRHAIDGAQGNPCVTGAPASSSGHASQVTAASEGSMSKRPLFKLAKYDGRTNVDIYLVQFKQLAAYLHWDEDDKFYNMCAI